MVPHEASPHKRQVNPIALHTFVIFSQPLPPPPKPNYPVYSLLPLHKAVPIYSFKTLHALPPSPNTSIGV